MSSCTGVDLPLMGRCVCRAVSYRVLARPLFVHCCHCTWCQRETGSAFVINALVERREIEHDGVLQEVVTPSASGAGQRIIRCVHCRVALWSHYQFAEVGEHVAFVRVGTLEDASEIRPDVHIFTVSKLPWLRLEDDVPVLPEYYRRQELWPEPSRARLRALRRENDAATARGSGE